MTYAPKNRKMKIWWTRNLRLKQIPHVLGTTSVQNSSAAGFRMIVPILPFYREHCGDGMCLSQGLKNRFHSDASVPENWVGLLSWE